MATSGREHKSKHKPTVTPARALPSPAGGPAASPLRSVRPAAFNKVPIGPPQTKLTVSQPGDAHEQEADSVADNVMRMGDADVSLSPIVAARSAAGAGGDD